MTETDWTNDYLRTLSDRVGAIEYERTQLSEKLAELKAEAVQTGVRWDAFMLAHKIRTKLTAEAQREWSATFETASAQLGLFADEPA